MQPPLTTTTLRIGDWTVNPTLGQISRGEETIRVEARTMRLLLCLAEQAGKVVSIDDLLSQVWSGVIVTQDSVYQAVASLRRLLGDDPKQPTYIATVPRLGYRMVATVNSGIEASAPNPAPSPSLELARETGLGTSHGGRSRLYLLSVIACAAVLACVGFYLFVVRDSSAQVSAAAGNITPYPKTIAVMPFLDLTDEMNEEPFADGMTEELIDKLSKVQGLMVQPPTASFHYKGKQASVAEIAKSLGVAYVLDGSVRKSKAALRVDARLIRADDGYVAWSETYDRPFADKLEVQDDIAGEVAKALSVSIK